MALFTSAVQIVSPTKYTVGWPFAWNITPIASSKISANCGTAYISVVPWEPPVLFKIIPSNSTGFSSDKLVMLVKPCALSKSPSRSCCTKILMDLGKIFCATSSQWSSCVWVKIIASTSLKVSSAFIGNSTSGLRKWLFNVPSKPA